MLNMCVYIICIGDASDSSKTEQTDPTPDTPSDSKEADKDEEKTLISCDAVEMDQLKHQKRTGSVSVPVDVSKIVVCLNYTQYMRLEDLFEMCVIGAQQREMMEKRYRELLLALCPELTEKLVIDLKACVRNGAVQVSDNLGVSVDPPTTVNNLDTGIFVS